MRRGMSQRFRGKGENLNRVLGSGRANTLDLFTKNPAPYVWNVHAEKFVKCGCVVPFEGALIPTGNYMGIRHGLIYSPSK